MKVKGGHQTTISLKHVFRVGTSEFNWHIAWAGWAEAFELVCNVRCLFFVEFADAIQGSLCHRILWLLFTLNTCHELKLICPLII